MKFFKFSAAESKDQVAILGVSKGDKIIMEECGGKIWECITNSYIDKSGDEVVHIVGFSGAFMCKYLVPAPKEGEKE